MFGHVWAQNPVFFLVRSLTKIPKFHFIQLTLNAITNFDAFDRLNWFSYILSIVCNILKVYLRIPSIVISYRVHSHILYPWFFFQTTTTTIWFKKILIKKNLRRCILDTTLSTETILIINWRLILTLFWGVCKPKFWHHSTPLESRRWYYSSSLKNLRYEILNTIARSSRRKKSE